jgi:hypothetical protein
VAVRHFLRPGGFAHQEVRRPGSQALLCSAKACQQGAVWALVWNNPRLHTPDRRKSWLACDEHRDQLAGFLRARGFLLDTVPVADAPSDPGPPACPGDPLTSRSAADGRHGSVGLEERRVVDAVTGPLA